MNRRSLARIFAGGAAVLLAASVSTAVLAIASPVASASTMTLTASPTTVEKNANVTYTATLSGATLSAAVQFYEVGVAQSLTPNGCTVVSSPPTSVGNGQCEQYNTVVGGSSESVAIYVTSWPTAPSTPSVYVTYLASDAAVRRAVPSASTSVNVVSTVTATPSIAVTANPSTITVGQTVTLTAHVTLNGSADNGEQVTFSTTNGSWTSAAVSAADSNGDYEVTTTQLPAGGLTVQAAVSGYATAVSTVDLTVNTPPAPPAISLVASSASITQGQSVTLTATVTDGGSADNSATVTFSTTNNSWTAAGVSAADSNGDYVTTTSGLPLGTSTVTASIDGASVSTSIDVTVSSPPPPPPSPQITSFTATSTTGSFASSFTVGESVNLIAHVELSGSADNGEDVVFTDGTQQLGSVSQGSNGDYVLTTSALPPGTSTVQAAVSGSSTAIATVQVTADPPPALDTSVSVLSVSPAAITTQGTVSLSAHITDARTQALVLDGSVTFYNESTSPPTDLGQVFSPDSAGDWVLPGIGALGSGEIRLEANFVGPTVQSSQASASVIVLNQAATPTVDLILSPANVTVDQSTTLNAAVVSNVAGVTPTGTVTFSDAQGNAIGTLALSGSGTASLAFTPTSVGSQGFTATYNGDAADNSVTSQTAYLGVNTIGTALTTSFQPTAPVYGGVVSLSSQVTSAFTGLSAPSGYVYYYFGSELLCSTAVSGTCTTTALPGGSDTVTAEYSGDSEYSGSTGTMTIDVGPAASQTVLTVSAPSTPVGQQVTLTAKVTGGGTVAPSGTVTFSTGSTTLCSDVALSVGSASCKTSILPAGASVPLLAAYSGDGNYAVSKGTAKTVVVDATTTVASASPSSTAVNGTVRLSATVTSASTTSGTPTGPLTFYLGSVAAANELCATALSGGTGSCTTTALPIGTDTVIASYGGDSDHGTSTGSTTVTVAPAVATVTVLSVSPNPSAEGESVTLSAEVSGNGPTGSVSFSAGSTPLCTAVPLAVGIADCTTTALPIGNSDGLSAVYSGDAANLSSTGTATATVVAVPPSLCTGPGGNDNHDVRQPKASGSGCEQGLLSNAFPQRNMFVLVGTSAAMWIGYSDESPLDTSANPPVGVLFTSGGQVRSLLSVSATPFGQRSNAELLAMRIPGGLSAGSYVAQITVHDSDGNEAQYSWNITVGSWFNLIEQQSAPGQPGPVLPCAGIRLVDLNEED